MELYYEQNVVNKNIDERTKRTKMFIIAKTICLVLGVFILVSSAMLIELFWIFILFSLPFFVASFILGRINKKLNVEYDYVIDDEHIKISEIYFRERRKLKYTVRLRLIESVGVFDSEGYKKVEGHANKKILALVNYDDESAIVYILYNTDKGKKLIFLEPDRGFMIALRRALSSTALTVFDKSVKDLEQRLLQKEQFEDPETDDDDDETEESFEVAVENDNDTTPEDIELSESEDSDIA